MERIEFGISELDRVLSGGLVKGTLSTLLGPPGAGKSILSKRFLYSGTQKDDEVFLVSTSESEGGVSDTMKEFNWSRGLDRLHVLDCYSWRRGGLSGKYAASPSSLTDVSVTLTRVLDDNAGAPNGSRRIVFDSFTDFVKYSGPERSLKFLDAVTTKLQIRSVTGLLLLEEGVHDERTISAVEYSTNGTIRMKITEQGRFMMVSRMSGTPLTPRWIPYAIGG